MQFILLDVILRLIVGIIGLVLTLLAIGMFRKYLREEDAILASFQLRPDETILDFQILFASNLIVMTGMTLYFLGAILEMPILNGAAGYSAMLFASIVMIIFYRWMRRV